MKKASFTSDLFQEELEQTAIERIQKFAKIANTMGLYASDFPIKYFVISENLCTFVPYFAKV